MTDREPTARQRKLERRREKRAVDRKVDEQRARRNRWITSAVLAVVFTAAIYGFLIFVWNPFPTP